jgi:hypothetical protein
LDTDIFEQESWLVAEKGLQPRMWTFHPRQNKLRKGTGILMLTVKKESSVRDGVNSVVTKNKRLLVL